MKDWRSQSHVKWECKYHVVILPKYRRKQFYGKLRDRIGIIIRELCNQKGVRLVEGRARPDHIHMLLSIPPKYSVAMTMGYLKGKSAVRVHRELKKTRGTLFGRKFWARGYCVSTVGLDEARIRQQEGRRDCRDLHVDLGPRHLTFARHTFSGQGDVTIGESGRRE